MIARGTPRLSNGRLLRGPNVHHGATVFVMRLDPGLLANARLRDVGPEFGTRFVERFSGSPISRDGTLLDALLEAILAIERMVARAMGRPDAPRFGRVIRAARCVELAWEASAAWISRAAAHLALTGLMELLSGQSGGTAARSRFERRMVRLLRQAKRRQWTPAAAAIVQAATEQRLAHALLAGNYVRLGEGVCQQVVSAPAMVGQTADRLLERLFPPGSRATIPVALVMGERGTKFVTRALGQALRASFRRVGLAVGDRITIEGRPVDPTSIGRRKGADVLLGDPRVEAVVGTASLRSILARGLGVGRADVVVLVDPSPGADLTSYEAGLEVVLNAEPTTVVVGVGNPFAERLTGGVRARQVVVVAAHGDQARAKDHVATGSLVVLPAADAGGGRAELRRGHELVGSMPMAWPRPDLRERPTAKQRARSVLASGGAFAVGLSVAPTLYPDDAGALRSRLISSTR
jgi:hypothetical protein